VLDLPQEPFDATCTRLRVGKLKRGIVAECKVRFLHPFPGVIGAAENVCGSLEETDETQYPIGLVGL
jgi:hypothetical protein